MCSLNWLHYPQHYKNVNLYLIYTEIWDLWSNVGCAFHIHFLLPIWISLHWVVFYSWRKPMPIWHQVLTKHTVVMLYTCFAILTVIFSSCSTLLWLLNPYNLSSSVPIMCPSSHHNGCAVGTGFGGLVSGNMEPFGATSCYSLHSTTVSSTRHHCLSFQCCGDLNAQLHCYHFIKQNSVPWS
jgi:hypothetical protein